MDNTRGILLMVAAVTGFIANDTFVKLASEDIPIPQIIVLRSLIALPLVGAFCWRQGLLRSLDVYTNRFLLWRTIGELGGTAAYLTALARMNIANTTAIAQMTPLAVTAAAALLLRREGRRPPLVGDLRRLPRGAFRDPPGTGGFQPLVAAGRRSRSASSCCATSPRAPCRSASIRSWSRCSRSWC